MFDQIPDALHDAIGIVIADQRRAFERVLDLLSAKSSAIISDLEAKVARLEVANEMLRVDVRRSVETEMERVREVVANVKDGRDGRDGVDGKDGEPGMPGEKGDSPEVDYTRIESFAEEKIRALMPPPEKGEPGRDGKDADEDAIVKTVLERIPAPKDGRDGRDGTDADPELVAQLVNETVSGALEKAIAALPVPQDGRDGVDGKDADEDAIIKTVLEHIPMPKDGRDGIDGKDGRDGKDAADIAGAFQTVEGKALLTLTDGRVLDLGIVKGVDGAPGRDGADGKDGRDGITFEDFRLSADHDGERTVTFRIMSKDKTLECPVRFPVPIDRGIYKRDVQYERADVVTYSGSFWIAQKETKQEPGSSPDWRLCVKAGVPGASAYSIAKQEGFRGSLSEWLASLKGDKGETGRPGRDLTRG